MLTLHAFDDAIDAVRKPTGVTHVDEAFEQMALLIDQFKQNQLDIINELLTMYDSASEHGVDVSRQAIHDLALRLAGER